MPAQPQSSEHVLSRSYLTAAAQAFGSLSVAERAAWETYANLNIKSHMGLSYSLYAINAYIQVNCYRQINGQAISDVAPTSLAGFSASLIATLGYVVGTTTYSFDVTHNGTNGVGFWVVSQTPVLASAQRAARPSDYRLIDSVAAASIVAVVTSPQTISITTPKYVPSDTDWQAVRVIPLNDEYAPGTETTFRGQVTVT